MLLCVYVVIPLFAGACGTNYSQFLTQRSQRRQARKGKEKVYISYIFEFLSRLESLHYLIPLPLLIFFLPLRALRLCERNFR